MIGFDEVLLIVSIFMLGFCSGACFVLARRM
jgi:hypothetical protein